MIEGFVPLRVERILAAPGIARISTKNTSSTPFSNISSSTISVQWTDPFYVTHTEAHFSTLDMYDFEICIGRTQAVIVCCLMRPDRRPSGVALSVFNGDPTAQRPHVA
jgi:hypothetical protein